MIIRGHHRVYNIFCYVDGNIRYLCRVRVTRVVHFNITVIIFYIICRTTTRTLRNFLSLFLFFCFVWFERKKNTGRISKKKTKAHFVRDTRIEIVYYSTRARGKKRFEFFNTQLFSRASRRELYVLKPSERRVRFHSVCREIVFGLTVTGKFGVVEIRVFGVPPVHNGRANVFRLTDAANARQENSIKTRVEEKKYYNFCVLLFRTTKIKTSSFEKVENTAASYAANTTVPISSSYFPIVRGENGVQSYTVTRPRACLCERFHSPLLNETEKKNRFQRTRVK